MQGKCTLFCNVAEFGGSRAFVRADNTSLWFAQKDGSKGLPKGSEGLVVVEVDLEKQFEVRKLAKEYAAVKDIRIPECEGVSAASSGKATTFYWTRRTRRNRNPARGSLLDCAYHYSGYSIYEQLEMDTLQPGHPVG